MDTITKTNAAGSAEKQLAVRLPLDLVERIEAHAARLREATPGITVSRVGALRSVLLAGLDVVEQTRA